MKAITLKAEVVKETEKAIQFSCEIEVGFGRNANFQNWKLWVPKKCAKVVDGGIAIAEWFYFKNDYPGGIVNAVMRGDDGNFVTTTI